MTLVQVANAIGVTQQAVSQWELDEDRPDLDNLPKIAKTLKTTCDFLLMNIGGPDGPDALELRIRELPPRDRALISGMLELVPKASDKTA